MIFRRRNLALLGSVLMFVGGVIIVAVAAFGLGRTTHNRGPFQSFAVATATPMPTAPAATATPQPSNAPIERIQIPSIGVDAPVVVLGVDSDGTMQAPDNRFDVAWYNFSSYPGWGSNAVFAGHVDFHPNYTAVFWYLRDIKPNDPITIRLSDGTEYTYRVVSADTVSDSDAPIETIVGPTQNEVITLITCDGTFNTKTHQYDKRLVVRAERVPNPPAGQARGGG